jgi:hypothetical protein
VEGIRGAAAVRRRVREGVDDRREFKYRAGPAVGDEKRTGIGVRAAPVDEMHALRIAVTRQIYRVVVPGVQARLAAAPVVVAGPVGSQLAAVGER